MNKKILLIGVFALTSLVLFAQPAGVPQGLQYDVSRQSIVITGYTGNATTLVIPAEIEGLPVTSILNGAFSGCTSLTSITIPNSVTSIGQNAFENCTRLANVTIGNGVTRIEQKAFANCTSLANITIPNSVTFIGQSAFWGTGLTRVTIPSSVTSIGNYDGIFPFGGCTNLTSITFEGRISRYGFTLNDLPGNLGDAYLSEDGGPGTYTRVAGGQVWRKQ